MPILPISTPNNHEMGMGMDGQNGVGPPHIPSVVM